MACFFAVATFAIRAQVTFPSNGAPFNPHSAYAFVNGTIHHADGTVLENGTLVIHDGTIVACSGTATLPAGSVTVDLTGKHVYPSFIDIFSDYGMPPVPRQERRRSPQAESAEKGAFGWNQAIKAHVDAEKIFVHQPEKADALRKAGFGAVVCCPRDGIVRGSGALVTLNSASKENNSVVKGRAAALFSFSKGSSTQDYPTSLVGAIALLRQTYYDAQWYSAAGSRDEHNISLEAFKQLRSLPALFDAGDKFALLRAARIGSEFSVPFIVRCGGNEYQRIADVAAAKIRCAVPLSFPDAYDVEDPYDLEAVSLADMKHWELAPTNPAEFERHGIEFCLTAEGAKDLPTFTRNLKKAVQYGLSEAQALRALTSIPAEFVQAGDRLGALKKGYIANFFITDRPFFDDDAQVMAHWVYGEPYQYNDLATPDLRGNYRLEIAPNTYTVKITGTNLHPSAQITLDTTHREFRIDIARDLVSFMFTEDSARVVLGSGTWNRQLKRVSGNAQLPSGDWKPFALTYLNTADSARKSPVKKQAPLTGKVIYPFCAYGEPANEQVKSGKSLDQGHIPPQRTILFTHATVWTDESEGILPDAEVLIAGGKIQAVGKHIEHPMKANAEIVDAHGKHLTPGIIDEHSHIALTAGVNEAGQASSAEVRMGDVINPEDVNIYRQLSGGVTTAQLLHGSANPIGGQSALIKLRWGQSPEQMKFEDAPPFIKFALGENVKQSNWGDMFNQRFPQTRMGVEQVYNDFFTRAKEYDAAMKTKEKNSPAVRRDLELDALAEILAGKRYITCHSYVQSEINMLMKLGDSLGFRVNTFTHILEGYKVADKMKAHGANASTFSDWWAYKNEVMEAIPYNAALMTRVGINVAVNSDDAEMARRLNQEAAKAVKYGGLTEEEALKLVTLNPAKMLHIDDRVGSIRAGKSADLVLWSDNPLSIYAVAEKTIIDGRVYFDRQHDRELRDYIRAERARLTAKMIMEKKKGGLVTKPKAKQPRLNHCNTIEGIDEELTGHR